ncbi:hypothetical protein BFR04_08530 [Gaetbulibacter sp. 4G1]|nr:glycosyltransferase [Gaetbulibacter sp. 4G1]PIA77478.1 hypothetical protein BFR04_08530 [Gaetbulibacter sp. 4G1]
MKLSVLIPVYNAENYIYRCLESLISQDISKSDYEIVIVNDGSTDRSLEIIEDISKKNVNIFVFSQKNRGTVFTRNRLMKLAKGEYIYFVDADDYIVKNSLGLILVFAEFNQLDIIGFNASVTYKHEMVNQNNEPKHQISSKIISGQEFLRDNKNIRIEIWWYLIRKDFLNINGIYFDRNDYDGDVVFTLRLFLEAKKIAFVPIQIYYYFQSLESAMRTRNNSAKKRIARYFKALVIDFSDLIMKLDEKKQSDISDINIIKNNFKFRRDTFTFFTIIKMIKANLPLSEVEKSINQFEAVNAYPIYNFINQDNNSVKYRFLNHVFNRKVMLYMVVRVFNLISKF